MEQSQYHTSPDLNLKKERTINLFHNRDSNINASFLSANDKTSQIFNATKNNTKFVRGSKRFGSINLKTGNPAIVNFSKSPSQVQFMKSQINDISQVRSSNYQYQYLYQNQNLNNVANNQGYLTHNQIQPNLNLTKINEKTNYNDYDNHDKINNTNINKVNIIDICD